MQSDFGEQSIHQKRGPGEVAGVFQDREKHEQQRDLRDEDDDRADAGEDTVGDEVFDRAVGQVRGGFGAQPFHAVADAVHDGRCDPEDGDEQRTHNDCEDDQAPEFVEQDAVNVLGEIGFWGVIQIS